MKSKCLRPGLPFSSCVLFNVPEPQICLYSAEETQAPPTGGSCPGQGQAPRQPTKPARGDVGVLIMLLVCMTVTVALVK